MTLKDVQPPREQRALSPVRTPTSLAQRVARAVVESRGSTDVASDMRLGSEKTTQRAQSRTPIAALGIFFGLFLLIAWVVPSPQPSLGVPPRPERFRVPSTAAHFVRDPSREDQMKNFSSMALGVSAAVAMTNVASADNHVLNLASGQAGALKIAHAAIQNAPAEAGAMTIEFWIRFEQSLPCCDSDPHGRPVSKRGCSSSGYTILARPSGNMGNELGGVTVHSVPINFDSWRHYAVTWSASERIVHSYVDGTLVSTVEDVGTALEQLSTELRFGYQCGRGMIGALDNVRIWSRVRTGAEIADDMSVQYTPAQAAMMSGLVGSWTFEGMSPLADGAGQNPEGVLEGPASIEIENFLSPPCPGDVDNSGFVDGVDLAIILTNWGPPSPKYPAADVNGDGDVNGADLAIVLSGWGACP